MSAFGTLKEPGRSYHHARAAGSSCSRSELIMIGAADLITINPYFAFNSFNNPSWISLILSAVPFT